MKRQGEGHAPLSINWDYCGESQQLQVPRGSHQRGPDLDSSHQYHHKNSQTTALLPLQAAEAQHGLQDTLHLQQVHHREHPDWLHRRLVCQLHRPQP